MPPRDPNIPQLDFPQLVADIIQQLQLKGQVGLLDFIPSVQPVYITAQRAGALSFDTAAITYGSAEIFSANVANPAGAAVIADTGQLPAGDYDCIAIASCSTDGVGGTVTRVVELQHRDAANLVNLSEVPFALVTGLVPAGQQFGTAFPFAYTLGTDERIRYELVAGGMGGIIATTIMAKRRPTP